jgi:hypothetical protein
VEGLRFSLDFLLFPDEKGLMGLRQTRRRRLKRKL